MSEKKIVVPALPESVSEAIVIKWYKKEGDLLTQDDVIVDLETDKIVLEIPASEAGVLSKIVVKEGDTVKAGEVLALISESKAVDAPVISQQENNKQSTHLESKLVIEKQTAPVKQELKPNYWFDNPYTPSQRRHLSRQGLPVETRDVEQAIMQENLPVKKGHRSEKRIPMTRLRQRIAERLLETREASVMLTLFHEVNMQTILNLQQKYGQQFAEKHGVELNLMPFYLKAVVEALKRFPELNASIDDEEIVYHNYFDIGISLTTPRGAVTPILHDVDMKNMAELEKSIQRYKQKAFDGKLTVEELTGGTFTISNNAVDKGLVTTPMIHLPQCAILGFHAIQERVIVQNSEMTIAPMMQLALSYDNRIIDTQDASVFLMTVKNMLEEPARLLLDI